MRSCFNAFLCFALLFSSVLMVEWHLVFKVATGGNGSFYDLYMGHKTLNMNNSKARSLMHPIKEHFKSDIVNNWESLDIETVKVSIYKNGTEEAFFLFDGVGTNKIDWFQKDRLINTSYTDLNRTTKTNYFSIDGHIGRPNEDCCKFYRRFLINAKYEGCPGDEGWLLISDVYSNGDCGWEHLYLQEKPIIIFSPQTTRTTYSKDKALILADSMSIHVTFRKHICPTMTSSPIHLYGNRYCYQPANVDVTIDSSVTMSELQDKVDLLKKELTVNRKTTSQYTRTFISAADDRFSSRAMGIMGGTVLALALGFIVCLDLVSCCKRRFVHTHD